MTTDDTLEIKTYKSALSSGKMLKYEYLTCDKILPYDQSKMTEEAKLTYSPLRKAFEKQIKRLQDQGRKQVQAVRILKLAERKLRIKDAIPEDRSIEEGQNEIKKKQRMEAIVKREDLEGK